MMILSTGYYQVALQWHMIISGIHIWHKLNNTICFLNYWPFTQKIISTHQVEGLERFEPMELTWVSHAIAGRSKKYRKLEKCPARQEVQFKRERIQDGHSRTRSQHMLSSTRRIYHSATLAAVVGKHTSQLSLQEASG